MPYLKLKAAISVVEYLAVDKNVTTTILKAKDL
jgi:hypothetical protein